MNFCLVCVPLCSQQCFEITYILSPFHMVKKYGSCNISMLRGVPHERYCIPTYIRSLAITVAMGPMAPLWDTTVPSAWGIALFLTLQVYSICCYRLAELQLHWNSAPTQTCYIASHDAMSTPCPLFRKHNALELSCFDVQPYHMADRHWGIMEVHYCQLKEVLWER